VFSVAVHFVCVDEIIPDHFSKLAKVTSILSWSDFEFLKFLNAKIWTSIQI